MKIYGLGNKIFLKLYSLSIRLPKANFSGSLKTHCVNHFLNKILYKNSRIENENYPKARHLSCSSQRKSGVRTTIYQQLVNQSFDENTKNKTRKVHHRFIRLIARQKYKQIC